MVVRFRLPEVSFRSRPSRLMIGSPSISPRVLKVGPGTCAT
jgi:hypothetical protein